MMHTLTIHDKMRENKKFSSGFDYMRLVLSVAVIISHAFILPYSSEVGQEFVQSKFYRPFVIILPMFFFLSGFLVIGSYQRSKNMVEFYGLRVIRIIPALFCEVTLMALLIGPIITTEPLSSYFSSPIFYSYFLNIIGEIHYILPGVFVGNPSTNFTNAQLWTIPYELMCYAVLGAMALVGSLRFRWLSLVILVILYVAVGFLLVTGAKFYHIRGEGLVVAFIAGVAAFLYSDKIPFDGRIAAVCALAVGVLVFIKGGTYLALVPIGYVTIYLGLLNPKKFGPVRTGDYSYGLYLFGYPIQQFVTTFGEWTHSWYINLAISLPLASIAAFLSWHYVEKPFQNLKGSVKKFAAVFSAEQRGGE